MKVSGLVTIRQSVNLDVEPCINTAIRRARGLFIGWIGNVQREMVIAVRIAIVDLVNALRRFHVAFLLFRSNRIATQRNSINLQHFAATQDR